MAAVEEEDEEDDWRRWSPAASVVVPLQMSEPVEGGSVWPGLLSGQGAQEEGREAPASMKAQGKVPTVEPPPPETDVEMVWQLQREEKKAERAWRGQDTATLVVVREAAGPMTWGQVEGLEAPS